MCIHLKIYIVKFDSFCVLLLEHFDFFDCYYSCLSCLIWFFAKTQNFHFHDQIKQKTSNKFHPLIKWEITNQYGNFSNHINIKESTVFQKSKYWGGLQCWLYISKCFSTSYTSLEISHSFYKGLLPSLSLVFLTFPNL